MPARFPGTLVISAREKPLYRGNPQPPAARPTQGHVRSTDNTTRLRKTERRQLRGRHGNKGEREGGRKEDLEISSQPAPLGPEVAEP